MKINPGDEYTCDVCNETYKATVPHDEAAAEHRDTFGFEPGDSSAVLCDECWQEFLPWAQQQGLTVEPS